MTAALDDAARAGVAALDLPNLPGLVVTSSRDSKWMCLDTDTGHPAAYTIRWYETVDAGEGETSDEPRLIAGTFATLAADLDAIARHPRNRSGDIELDVNEWALRYRLGVTA